METTLQRSFDDLGTPLHQVTFVVVDVETTGGSPASSSLTEVAAARYRGGELLGTYQTFVNPDERIPPFITALTGISDAMVADAPRIGEMLPSFLEFVGAAVLVGHNIRFDLSFLDHALVSTGRERMSNVTVDTLPLARRLVRDMVDNCKLGTLAASLRLEHQPSHRALTDVLATGDLLHALLERAGSFGILELEELLDLPRLVGHPQAAKLKLTTRLPHRSGVYWFTDAAGNVLYVGKATDLQARVRSYFAGDRRHKIGRLLRQLHAIHHRVCPGPLTASVLEGRLIRAWSPPYNRQGKVRRGTGPTRTGTSPGANAPAPGRRRGRRKRWNAEELGGDPWTLLEPLARQVLDLSGRQQFEEAATARDEAERLRALLVRQRRTEALRRAGRLVVEVGTDGVVEFVGGVLIDGSTLFGPLIGLGVDGTEVGPPGTGTVADTGTGAGADVEVAAERIIVAHWLEAHADEVRIVDVGADQGLSVPAVRIPTLAEVCAGLATGPGATAGSWTSAEA